MTTRRYGPHKFEESLKGAEDKGDTVTVYTLGESFKGVLSVLDEVAFVTTASGRSTAIRVDHIVAITRSTTVENQQTEKDKT